MISETIDGSMCVYVRVCVCVCVCLRKGGGGGLERTLRKVHLCVLLQREAFSFNLLRVVIPFINRTVPIQRDLASCMTSE